MERRLRTADMDILRVAGKARLMGVDLSGLSEECVGMFGAMHALTVSLVNQGALDREKFIDQMLDLLAQMPEHQRHSYYGRYLALAVQMFEATQFPEPPQP